VKRVIPSGVVNSVPCYCFVYKLYDSAVSDFGTTVRYKAGSVLCGMVNRSSHWCVKYFRVPEHEVQFNSSHIKDWKKTLIGRLTSSVLVMPVI
jgi:hypothetical protein